MGANNGAFLIWLCSPSTCVQLMVLLPSCVYAFFGLSLSGVIHTMIFGSVCWSTIEILRILWRSSTSTCFVDAMGKCGFQYVLACCSHES